MNFKCHLFCTLRSGSPPRPKQLSHHSSGRRLSPPPPLVKARPRKDLAWLDSPRTTRSRRRWARAGLPSAAASEALPSAVPAPDPAPPAGPPRSSLLHVDCEKNMPPSARQPKAKRDQMANGKRARVGSGTAKLVPAVPRDRANTKRTDATSMSSLCFARSHGLACQ